jgi:catechol 2,3-dioxygenase-like lactoylglutathione lyase family enzyme
MTLARTLSNRTLATRSLWRASAAMVLSLAALPAAAQNQLWIRQLGTSTNDAAYGSAPDGSGGAYMGGATNGSLGGPSAGSDDAWLARYDSAGSQLWIRQLGSSAGDAAFGVAPDGAGGLFISGSTSGNLGGPSAGSVDAWLARYDGAGNQLWVRQLGTSAGDGGGGAAPDGSGGVYVSGWTQGILGGLNAGTNDAWLARYDSAGKQLWVRQLGTSANDFAGGAAPDGSGGVYVAGDTRGNLGGVHAGAGYDVWLAHYDSAGNQLWIRQLGTATGDQGGVAAPDASGGVYWSGLTLGNLGGPSAGVWDAWLARYDSAGNQVWIRQLGTSSEDAALAAAPDGSGGVYLGGQTLGSLGGPNAGHYDAWLARYDSAGNQLWIDQLGTSTDDYAYAAAPDASGGVYLSGRTDGSLGGPSAGGSDAWLARYDTLCGASSKYCTAKTSSAGCVPSIATSGTPSASAGSGFTISTTSVLDNKFGLYFYGKSGPNNAPFQGGILCAAPPLVRTLVQNSGGTPPCGGAFQIDFNAYVASGADPALVAGAQVWVQTWSRDPGFAPPNNTSLSDAVSFTLCQ